MLLKLKKYVTNLGGILNTDYINIVEQFDYLLNSHNISKEDSLNLSEYELLTCEAKIIEVNELVREGEHGWSEDHKIWPNDLLVIGDDNCGGYYYINIKKSNPTVGYYEHEIGEFQPLDKSPKEFLYYMANGYTEEPKKNYW